ncbi:transposase [Duganella sp. FT50W]|uniref:Transposase n=1 Tax=Duganella lactea TaxID=2692173 RepID=A0A6L8MS93_9BURK|nr:transposase [Duganella lactea]MYM84908.1 transposase [Duganella lactea]
MVLESSASVARIAREHGVNVNQVFSWRRLYQQDPLGAPALMRDDGLLPVELAQTATATDNAGADAEGTIVIEGGADSRPY